MNTVAACVAALLLPSAAAAGELDYFGHVSGIIQVGDASLSWLDGDLGRDRLSQNFTPRGEGQLGLAYRTDRGLRWFAHLAAFAEDVKEADALGLVQWGLDYGRSEGLPGWQVRAGQFFTPGSQENTAALWQSPYATSFSMLNSWIGNEVRPIGVAVDYEGLRDAARWRIGASLDYGNDASASLLAWRGFARDSRLGLLGETVPLPAIAALSDTGSFFEQRDDGAKPFGRDLDGSPGFSAWLHWERLESFQLDLSWSDSQGDRRLHRGEYAWDTTFGRLGGTWWLHPDWTIAGEYMLGKSGMGRGGRRVDIDFDAWYLLVSRQVEHWTTTLRLEGYEIDDRDQTADDPNADDGWHVTLAARRDFLSSPWQVSFELGVGDSDRIRMLESGLFLDEREITALIEFRYLINP